MTRCEHTGQPTTSGAFLAGGYGRHLCPCGAAVLINTDGTLRAHKAASAATKARVAQHLKTLDQLGTTYPEWRAANPYA